MKNKGKGAFTVKKNILLFLLILFILPVTPAFAHTGLHDSVPKQGEVVTEPLSQIVLTFESKIEQGSSFELTTAAGATIKPEQVTVENTLLKGSIQPLENGEYTLVWKVIGADGHPIDGKYSFSVNVPATSDENAKDESNQKAEPESSKEDEELTEGQKSPEKATNETINENAVVKSDEEESGISPIAIGVGILILILLIISINRVAKRRR
jgi:copper resistance protein C